MTLLQCIFFSKVHFSIISLQVQTPKKGVFSLLSVKDKNTMKTIKGRRINSPIFKASNHAIFRFIQRVLGLDIAEEDISYEQTKTVRILLGEAMSNQSIYEKDVTTYHRIPDYPNTTIVTENDTIKTVLVDGINDDLYENQSAESKQTKPKYLKPRGIYRHDGSKVRTTSRPPKHERSHYTDKG